MVFVGKPTKAIKSNTEQAPLDWYEQEGGAIQVTLENTALCIFISTDAPPTSPLFPVHRSQVHGESPQYQKKAKTWIQIPQRFHYVMSTKEVSTAYTQVDV